MKNFLNKKNIGFMTVEILVALSIITISVLATSNVVQKSFYLSQKTLENTKANLLLEQGAEFVRLYRDYDWNNISSLTSNTDYYFNETISGDNYNFEVNKEQSSLIDGKYRLYFRVFEVQRDDTSNDIVDSVGTADNGTKKITIYVDIYQGEVITSTKSLSFYLADIN